MSDPDLPRELPLFPLPDHVLLPEIPTLYRIFEPRYRMLVQDLQALPHDRQWLAVPRLQAGWQEHAAEAPAFHPIAAAARLRRVVPMSTGEFHIVVEGVLRCRLAEVASVRSYRIARAEPCEDLDEPAVDPRAGLERLLAQVQALGSHVRLPEGIQVPTLDGVSARKILNRLAGVLLADADERQAWLECRLLSLRMPMLGQAIERLRQQPSPNLAKRFRPSEN